MKDFLKKYGTRFLLMLITLLGLYLRLKYINRPDGLWFDEAFSYHIAIHKFPFGIMEALYKGDFHAPFYFFLLHFWIKLFGNADVTLRVFSVLISVISIPIVYLLGKESVNKKVGLFSALILAINAFHIYMAQEIRFYVLSSVFIMLSSLFLVRFMNNKKVINLVGLAIFNLLLCITLSYGVFFAFFQGILGLIYFYIKDRENFKKFFITQVVILLCYLPYVPFIFHQFSFTQTAITKPFDWYIINYKKMLYAFSFWFSPCGLNDQNAVFASMKSVFSRDFLFCLFFPLVFIAAIITKGLKFQNHKIGLITLSIVSYCSFQLITTLIGKTAFIERYTIVVLPLAIVVLSYFSLSLKSKILKSLIIFILIASPLWYEFFNSNETRSTRTFGFGYIQRALNYFDVSNDDILLMPFGGQVLYKYNPIKVIPINDIDLFYVYMPDKLKLIFDEDTVKHINRKNIDFYAKKYWANFGPNEPNRKNYDKEISKLGLGRYFVIVSSDELERTDIMLECYNAVKTNDEFLRFAPKLGLLMKKIEFDYFNLAKNDPKMEYLGVAKQANWSIYIFKKIK